ncbi:ParB/RepB/Spo0J family partition protein [Streptomyces sp. NBC_01230]|uniref:ParB/RepB/Spo0J family partition protein n=1 Tax=Streptomyces sp. NBC_01230 TaxID=2903784 RepID=UPI002E106129|nr:ParB/RepB/Spo0J family partition protein [Streptomyces sp. NBC_01230]
MADITITHTRAEGTLLEGSQKGDGAFELVRSFGFWFSRSLDGLYIRHSRDKEAQHWRINGAATALREAGHDVTIEIDEDTRRTFAEAEADREERADDRAERFSDRADRAVASADVRRATADQISKRFEFGQPILVGHHSEGRARRDAARIDSNMRKSFEDRDRAGYWADRTRASENYTAHRNNPQRTLRRLERLRADLRQQERAHANAVEKGWVSVGRHARLIQDLTEEIAHWEQIVEKAKADGVKLWGPDDFAPGDYALYAGSWYGVARVNPKTLSIAWNLRLAPKQVMSLEDATLNGRVSTHPADYTQVQGRCPGEAMNAFLANGKVPGKKSAREASEAAPADAIREAQAKAKAKAPKKRTDPKIPKRVKVECRWDATEATLTWLNGNNQPHKGHPPVTITAPDGVKFTESVWSESLLSQVTALLTGAGLTYGAGAWTGGRGRGIVRVIEPVPEAEPEALAVDEQPTPEPPTEATPAADVPSEVPVEDAAGGEQTASDLRFLSNHPVPHGESRVSHSVDPLNTTPHSERPDAMSDTTATAQIDEVTETAPAKKAPAAKKASAKKAPAKAVAKKTPVQKTAIEPTRVSKRREIVAEKAAPTAAEVKSVQKTIPIDRIDRDPNQPREIFDQAKLEELAGSMRELGQLQPITVRYIPGTRRYVVIMGERRWRAAGMAGLTEMTALVMHGIEADSREILAMAVAENVGRADMTPMEEAKAFKRLEKGGYTIDEIGGVCGKSPAYVGWRMDLLRLCEPAQEAVAKGHLSLNLAWYASQLSCDNQLRFLAKYARGAFSSDRDAEAFVKAARIEEERRESQGSFFVLADEAPAKPGDVQELLPGAHDVPEEERERIIADRSKLTKKIDKLSTAGEILSELATADPEELALLLAGVAGGVGAHQHRIEHLRSLTTKVIKNLRDAQAIAAVRAGAIEINPDAVAPAAPAEADAA